MTTSTTRQPPDTDTTTGRHPTSRSGRGIEPDEFDGGRTLLSTPRSGRGAHLHCEAPEHRLAAPTRKLMTVRFAIVAAQRMNRLVDPQGHAEF